MAQTLPQQLRALQVRYARVKARVRGVGFLCEGSLVERWISCGKPTCACCQGRPHYHGPYYQLSWKRKGKTHTRLLTADRARLYRIWIKNRRLLDGIVRQMHLVSQKAGRYLLEMSAPKSESQRRKKTPRRSG